jgi:hypothetical protein
MTDSTCSRFFVLESVLSEIILIGNFFGMNRLAHTGPKFKVNITKQFPTKTKNFPTETLLGMIDSSIKNPREAEYVKQN